MAKVKTPKKNTKKNPLNCKRKKKEEKRDKK
jgi:hypothetical protein